MSACRSAALIRRLRTAGSGSLSIKAVISMIEFGPAGAPAPIVLVRWRFAEGAADIVVVMF
jgi:hypothetical protein